MPTTYGAPGVYIQEMPSASMTIEGVGTAVAAFVGFTQIYNPHEGDPTDPDGVRPQLVTSWPQYERIYGGFLRGAMLPFAVKGYFENGGTAAFIVRIPTTKNPDPAPPRSLPSAARPELESMRVEALDGSARYDVVVEHPPPPAEGQEPSNEFTLRLLQDGQEVESYPGLNVAGRGEKSADRVVNKSTRIRVDTRPSQGETIADRIPAAGMYPLEPASVATVAVSPQELEGSVTERTGYYGLAIAEQVTMVAIPDLITVATNSDGKLDEDMYLATQGRLVDWCEESKSRMAILDVPPGRNATQALRWREQIGRDSAFAAAYYPQLVIQNPLSRPGATNGDRFITVPPCGHVAGVWARTDGTRGVWKAPANETVRGIARLETEVTAGEQDLLNPESINCIRPFGSYGMRIWGSRTLSKTDPSWRYINVRRLFIFLEESIKRGTQWVVFEPNDRDLWARVKHNVSTFLRGMWMQGALVGATPEQAFFVICDESNNPKNTVKEGKLFIDVGVAPSTPAEFVTFRISQWDGPQAG